ncbi:cytochrome c oxidase assembly protein [Candidatus Neomicrothrix sp.]|uniref:cytochrome c oxidase assembly protein n=1 Tax=Candidatus Neomicrothrix sp. TaxID=2719034 RepID=UPI003CD0CFB0
MFGGTLAKLQLTSATRFPSNHWSQQPGLQHHHGGHPRPAGHRLLRAAKPVRSSLDLLWIVAAVALWLPLISPIEHRWIRYPGKMGYLFVTVGIVVIVPSAALIITEEPMYLTYELAPRVLSNWSALEDQQFAGVIMKLGATPIVWGAILALFIRWTNESGPINKFGPKYHGRLCTQTERSMPNPINGRLRTSRLPDAEPTVPPRPWPGSNRPNS